MKVIDKISVIIETILLFIGLGLIIASIITKDVITFGVGAVVYLSSSLYIYNLYSKAWKQDRRTNEKSVIGH